MKMSTQYTTPWSGSLNEGNYRITAPASVLAGGVTYVFVQWEDGTTNPVRTIALTADATITVTYAIATHKLTVSSTPVTGVPFTVEKV
jgi:hypothetical protein